jgi:hypothetical protein
MAHKNGILITEPSSAVRNGVREYEGEEVANNRALQTRESESFGAGLRGAVDRMRSVPSGVCIGRFVRKPYASFQAAGCWIRVGSGLAGGCLPVAPLILI